MSSKMEKDIERAAREMRDRENGTVTPMEVQDLVDPGGVDADEEMADLFSHVPPDEGFYIKIYKKFPVPKEYNDRPMFLLDIAQPDLISDIESEILSLTKLNGWGNGIYEARLFKRGKKGVSAVRRVAIQLPTPPPLSTANGSTAQQTDPFAALNQALTLVKSIYPPSDASTSRSQAADPVLMMKALTEAFQAGVKSGEGKVQPESQILELVTAIKEMTPKPEPAPDPILLLEKMQRLLPVPTSPTPPVVTPTVDPFTQFREMMLLFRELQPPKQEDQSTKVLDMVAAILPLIQAGGGDGEKPSIGVEIVRALAPRAEKMVSDISEAVKAVAGRRASGPIPMPGPVQQTLPTEQQEPTIGEGNPVLPVFMSIQKAAETNDQVFYPQLDEILARFTTPAQYDGLLNGQIPAENLLAQVASYAGPFFTSPTAKIYLMGFMKWKSGQRAGEVIAQCSKCGTEWTYTSKEEFEKDPKCQEDGEQLVLKT